MTKKTLCFGGNGIRREEHNEGATDADPLSVGVGAVVDNSFMAWSVIFTDIKKVS